MFATFAVSVWLGAFGLFVATFVFGLTRLVLRVYGWPPFVGTLLIIFLANRAIASSGLRGKYVLGFYKNKPSWILIVQVLLLGLMPVLGFSIPPGRANGDVCATTVDGQRVELSAADCQTLRVRTLRFFAESWMAWGWLAVAQFALPRKGNRFAGAHEAGRST